jgi:phosphatidylserine/phosphatidylglycerophosphate/cardiolipin synthase-like enzyme
MRRLHKTVTASLAAALMLAACWRLEAAPPQPTAAPPPAGPIRLWQDVTIFQPVREVMATARERLWVEMYEFERADLAESMALARTRGVDVRLVYDPSVAGSRAIAQRLRTQGVESRPYPLDDSRHQIDHVKLLLTESAGLVGGMNWGRHSSANHDYAVETDLSAVLAALAALFEHDWQLAAGLAASRISETPTRTAAVVGPAAIAQTAPGEGIREALTRALRAASRNISAELFVLTDADIMADLAAAAHRGVRVRLLLDPNQDANRAAFSVLQHSGVSVRWYRVRPGAKLHAKAGLLDGRLLLGSANWSRGGLTVNHELDLILESPAAAGLFASRFEADWALAD